MRKGIHFLFGAKEPVADFRAIIDRFSDIGYTCVELPPEPFMDDKKAAKDIVNYAASKNVEIIFSCGFPADCDMASDSEFVRLNGRRYLNNILDVMEYAKISFLGGTFYTRWPSYRTQILTCEEKRSFTERTADCLRESVSTLEDRGITLAIEPLNRFEGFLINTAEEGTAFCDLVGNKQLGIMLDVFHMSMEEDNIFSAILKSGKYLKHLHLAENNRKLPGTGSFDWRKFFISLKNIGYCYRLDTESFITAEGSVSASVALWRDLSNNADEEGYRKLMSQSLGFISHLEKEYLSLSE